MFLCYNKYVFQKVFYRFLWGQDMEQDRLSKYYFLLEKISEMTCRTEGFDRAEFVEQLKEFAVLFRLSKGVTEFYSSPRNMEEGIGEILCDYDNGKEGKPVVCLRVSPPSGVIIIGTLYMSDDEEPLTEEEYEKVKIVYGLVLSFIARNRLANNINHFVFKDEDGFNNRRFMMRYIDQVISEGKQYSYHAVCINLRNFGAINQKLGRIVGDKILLKYYEHLESLMGNKGAICRLGGDNFILFFQNELRDVMSDAFRETVIVYDKENNKSITVGARGGIYIPSPDMEFTRPEQIMDKVHPALLIAKQRGVDYVFYDQELLKLREHRAIIRTQFANAMAQREIVAYYQPKVDVFTGKVVGAEALCRWFQNGKMVMPMEFIPILEMNMDICKLDFYMFETVCRDIRKWLDEGKTVPRISVNFSRKHLGDSDVLGKILEIINRYEIRRKYLEIELTETTTDVEFKDLNRIVTGLHREGISTSVDDFGNGYSSLNLIRSIPWNVVKIDRSLLPDDSTGEDDITRRMYKHIVSMANDIGLECVTEGVETKKQIELLKANHCIIAQGFYFDKPMPADKFASLLEGTPYREKL